MTKAFPKIKYTYFDLAARGEPGRLAMIIGGIPFEDNRVQFPDFRELKPTLPLGSLPVIEIDDGAELHSQSNAILRYIGKLTGLYPEDPLEALLVDEVIDTTQDFFLGLFKSQGKDEEEVKHNRSRAIEEGGKRFFGGAQDIIEKCNPGGTFILSDERLSIADIVITSIYTTFETGFLDHIPEGALFEYKRMKAIHDKIMERPEVMEHYQSHPVKIQK